MYLIFSMIRSYIKSKNKTKSFCFSDNKGLSASNPHLKKKKKKIKKTISTRKESDDPRKGVASHSYVSTEASKKNKMLLNLILSFIENHNNFVFKRQNKK